MATAKQKEINKIKKDIYDIRTRIGKLASMAGDDAVSELESLRDALVDEISEAGTRLDEYARDRHWQIGAIAAIAGLISGFLLGRRD